MTALILLLLSFSAVCLFFGQQVQDDLGGDIPFGLVDATWGGTIIGRTRHWLSVPVIPSFK